MSKTAQEIITEALESLGVSGDAVKLPDPQERVQAFRVTSKSGWDFVGISRDGEVLHVARRFKGQDGIWRINEFSRDTCQTLAEYRLLGNTVDEWDEPFLYEAAKAKGLI